VLPDNPALQLPRLPNTVASQSYTRENTRIELSPGPANYVFPIEYGQLCTGYGADNALLIADLRGDS